MQRKTHRIIASCDTFRSYRILIFITVVLTSLGSFAEQTHGNMERVDPYAALTKL